MRKILIIILLFILSNGFCYAQEALDCNKLTLPQAIDLALSKNVDIQSTRLNIEKSRNDINIAKRLQNPYIQMFYNGGKAATDNPNNMGLIQPIEIAKRGPRKRLAQAKLDLMQKNVAFAEFNLKIDVRQAYVNLVAAKSVLKILEDQQKLLQELVDIAQKKYDVGVSPEMDLIHAKMALNQLTTQVNTARTNIDVARYNFNKTLDIQDNSLLYDTAEAYLPTQSDFIFMLTPKPKEIMPDFCTICDIATQKRLDMKIAQQEIEVAQKNLVVVIRQKVPDIEIGGGGIFVPAGSATSGVAANGGYIASNIVNIPLFYQYLPEIKNAKIQINQSELNYITVKNVAINDLHSSYNQFLTAQKNLNYYNDLLLGDSERLLSLSKTSYMVGKTSIADLIFIEQSYKTIMVGYTNALTTYYNSWVDFLREVNDEEIKLSE
ncbi:MAG: TolC family protein [bacterium]